uniref:Uncharacterized protein n=1 Tax=Arundo donax TaxID=35708 RepID=A0A0A9GAT9_ARUDO
MRQVMRCYKTRDARFRVAHGISANYAGKFIKPAIICIFWNSVRICNLMTF